MFNNKEEIIMFNNIYYIVTIKEEYQRYLSNTTCDKIFCGKIVNQANNSIYFELNGSKAIVIIPHEWIKTMAPSLKLWKPSYENDGINE